MSFCIKEKEGNTLNKKMLHCTQEHHTDIRGEVVQPLEFCKDFFFINLNNSFIPIFKLIFIAQQRIIFRFNRFQIWRTFQTFL